MSTVATLLVRVAGDTKDAEKAFAGLETAGKSLERAYSGLGTRLSGIGGDLAKGLGSSLSGIESAAGKAFGALDQGLGKVGQALGPIANMLPGLPGPVSALAGAFGGFVPVAGLLGGVGVALGAIGGIAVGIVGGLVALGKSAADAGDAMLVLSQQSGISVENLSRFQYVEQQTDASVDKIVGSIRKLGTNLVAGSKEANTAITSIGLSLADVKKLKPEDAFVAIVDGLGKIPSAAERAHAGAAIFGKGWHDVSQLASEDLRGLMKEADLFGATMTTELAVAGDRFNDTLGQLSTVIAGFARAAGAGVLPVLTAVAEVLRDQVIVQLQATGTTAATVQGTFETFAVKVALAIAQVTASVSRGIADLARLFAKPIIGDSMVMQDLQRLVRMVSVLNGIKLDTLNTVSSGAQAMADALTLAADELDKNLPGTLARIKAEIAAAAKAMKDGQGAASGYGTAMSEAGKKLNDLVDTLSGASVVAKAREMMEAFAALTARGLKPTAAGARLIVEALDAADDALLKTDKIASAAARGIAASLRPLLKVVPAIRQSFANLAPAIKAGLGLLASRELTFTPTVAIDTRALTQTIVRDLRAIELGAAMKEWGQTLKTQLTGVLSSMFTGQMGFIDGLKAMFGAAQGYASEFVGDFVKALGKEISDAFKKGGVFNPKDIFGGNQVAGAIAGGAVGATIGATLGTQFGQDFGKAAGIAMGAASGALSGAMVGMMAGPQAAAVAAVIGGVVGAVSGYLAAAGEEKKQKAMMAQTRRDLEATFGTVEDIHAAADRLGISWSALWDTKDPIQFETAIAHLNQQLQREKKLVDDLRKGLEATAAAGALISAPQLRTIKEHREHGHPGADEAIGAFMKTQQNAALAGLDAFLTNAKIKTQAGATAISASLAGIYQSLIDAGVAPTAAFAQMEPVIAKFQANLAAVNATAEGTKLTGAAAFAPLAALANMAADAVGGPMMDAMAGLEQGLTATANMGLLNQETFGGFAAEMLAGFKQMEALGKGGEVALAGMQGGLQKLWELSTDFGYTLGPNEQAMLDFAVASGTVGDKFRPAADRMANAIDALVDRMDKFLAKFDAMVPAANDATRGVEQAFAGMRIPPVEVPFRPTWEEGYTPGSYTPPGSPGSTMAVPAMGTGGIVRRPTLALVGESGPEAVVPLSKDFGGEHTTHVYLDGEVIARSVTKRQPGVLRAYGVMRVIRAIAMAFTLTVGGLDVIAAHYLHLAAGAVSLDATLQSRGLLRFTLKDRAGVYRPALHAEVIAELDGVRVFGGNLTTVDEQDWGDYQGIWCPCEAADFGAILDTMLFNGVLPGVTLRELVQDMVDQLLGTEGFTVHAAMADGPALGPIGQGFAYVRDVFDNLGTMAQWPWIVTPYKEILFAEPGLASGPFDLTATNETINSLTVHHGLDDYANMIWIHFGATGAREVTDTWHGDSSTKLFPVTYPNPENVVSGPPTVLINGVTKPVATWGVDTGYDWYWRASDAALIQDFGIPTLTPADTLIATYVANFPGAVYAADNPGIAAYGHRDLIEAQPTVFDTAQARQIAAGRLIERGGPLRKIDAVTHRPGLAVGQNITVTVPERTLDERCLVLGVQMSLDGMKADDATEYWRFAVSLVEGAQYFETWQKFWRVTPNTGSAQSGSGTVGPPVGGGGGGSGGTSTTRFGPVYFGGSRIAWMAGAGWQAIPGFVDVLIDPAGGLTQILVRCQSWVLAAGMTVQVRLVSVSGTPVGIGAAVSATSATDAGAFQEFTATLLGTAQYYRLEAQVTGTSGEGAVAGVVAYPPGVAMRRRG